MKKRSIILADHKRWIACKKRTLSKNLSYCHPTWPGERDYIRDEVKRVKRAPSMAKAGRVWYYYELVYLVILISVIGTRIADILLQDNPEVGEVKVKLEDAITVSRLYLILPITFLISL